MWLRDIGSLLKATVVEWIDDNAARVAASLAFYTLLSMAPLMILSIAIAGVVLGEDTARQQIVERVGALIGPQAAGALDAVVASAHHSDSGVLSSIIGVVVLLAGASGVFGELQYALDTIWGVKPKPQRGVLGVVKDRLFSFAMVIGVAFVLLVSLVVSAVVSGLGSYMADALPGGALVWQVVNLCVSLAVITALFAMIYKVVPDVEIRWRDVWVGAFVTAALFNLGKYLLGIYLGRSSVASSYGAAGSVVALVVWVYYSSQLVFLGAEFTQVFAKRFGVQIRPSKNAMMIGDKLSRAT
ncbi:MAG TPA: YihY/virulence factor BrkB family protein [Polyangiales bacterium]|nr:YihY/virulence factor BrkB family protein [Polyangiales bacterium]